MLRKTAVKCIKNRDCSNMINHLNCVDLCHRSSQMCSQINLILKIILLKVVEISPGETVQAEAEKPAENQIAAEQPQEVITEIFVIAIHLLLFV